MEGDEQYGKPPRPRLPNAANNQAASATPFEHSLRRKEKFNSALIISIGFLTLVFGLGSMSYGLANPFEDILKKNAAEQAKVAAAQQLILQQAMTVDTDGDGLSDYDEANKHNTNPYLKDSNGDGIDDKTSIEQGIDPNCAEGQVCFGGTPVNASVSTSSASTAQLQTGVQKQGPTISAAYIRTLLVSNGATQEQLSGVSDTELIEQFRQYLRENPEVLSSLKAQGLDVDSFIAVASATSSAVSLSAPSGAVDIGSLNIKSAADLKNLTGAQIRQLMISSGASSAVLSAVGDEELKQIFIKQLEAKTQ